jgi:hypothetical protein
MVEHNPNNMKAKAGSSALLLACSVLVGCLIAEGLFRLVVFSNWAATASWRSPLVYSDYYSDDDYWLLYDRMDRSTPRPSKGHQLLGWLSPPVNPETYEIADAGRIGTRRPVLLYGDSFAQCWPTDQINENSKFSRRYHLLNYGQGGYGLDQIYLLYKNSIHHYNSPVVLISFLLEDIDRCILSVRDYAKPFFSVGSGNGLELKGVPIATDVDSFYRSKSPSMNSYFYAAAVHHPKLPDRVRRWLTNADAKDRRKKEAASAIILLLANDLESRGIPFVFLVFHPVDEVYAADDWRTVFLKDLFEKHHIPHVWMRDILRSHIPRNHYDPNRFVRSKEDRHGKESWYAPMSQWLVERFAGGSETYFVFKPVM